MRWQAGRPDVIRAAFQRRRTSTGQGRDSMVPLTAADCLVSVLTFIMDGVDGEYNPCPSDHMSKCLGARKSGYLEFPPKYSEKVKLYVNKNIKYIYLYMPVC